MARIPPGIGRRTVLASAAAGAAGISTPAVKGAASEIHVYVGSFTSTERQARGEGVSVYRMDLGRGVWTHLQTLGGLLNPSYLAFDRSGRRLYAAHGDSDTVSAFAVAPDGRLSVLNAQSTGGRNPVHLALDPSGRWLVVANLTGCSLAVLPVRDDGALGPRTDLADLGAPGPERRSGPHQAVFDPGGRFVAVPDRGLDLTFSYRLDAASGRLVRLDAPPLRGAKGSGARHIAFHPQRPLAFLLNEQDSTLAVLAVAPQTGRLSALQVLKSTSPGFAGPNFAADIDVSPDGRFVYASNRGEDTVGAFALAPDIDELAPVAWRPTGGRVPRNIALSPDGRFLFAANERSDTVTRFSVDRATGRLSPLGEAIAVASPVCIAFRPKPRQAVSSSGMA